MLATHAFLVIGLHQLGKDDMQARWSNLQVRSRQLAIPSHQKVILTSSSEMSDSSFRVDLMRETVSWAEKLDEMGSKSMIRLDDKSQQTGTVAGVFLAAALSFLKPDSLSGFTSHVRIFVGILLLLGVLVLVGCVATCLSVTWLQFVPVPITLNVMQSLTEDIAGHDDDDIDSDVKLAAYRERLKIWHPILEDRIKLNRAKAVRLQVAQILLATGILLIAVLLFTICRSIITGAHI